MMKIWASICLCVTLIGCGLQPSLDAEKLSDRTFQLERFFDGRTTAHGQFQDVLGNVSRRFVVDITGRWADNTLTLVEDFTYSDTTTEQRVWTLTKGEDGQWYGTAPGVVGQAQGRIQGDMFYWTYTIDLPIPDGDTMRVTFDDYMWVLADDRVLNIAYMSKYGVPLGQVIIMFERAGS